MKMVFHSWRISDNHDSEAAGADEEKNHSCKSQNLKTTKDARENKEVEAKKEAKNEAEFEAEVEAEVIMSPEMEKEMKDVIESRFFKRMQEGKIQDYSSFTYTQLNYLRSVFLDNIKKELEKVPAGGAEETLPESSQLADYCRIKEWKFQYDQLK